VTARGRAAPRADDAYMMGTYVTVYDQIWSVDLCPYRLLLLIAALHMSPSHVDLH
jgi:hypothetical protein